MQRLTNLYFITMHLADASRYLSARAEDGLQAAESARADVDGMHEKQQGVIGQVETLNSRSQDEAAISRELSASLEEMAGALEVYIHQGRVSLQKTILKKLKAEGLLYEKGSDVVIVAFTVDGGERE